MHERVLITGFTGQVGSQLADFLLQNTSSDVYGMMRWQEDLTNIRHLNDRINNGDKVFVKYADLTDFSSLYAVVREVKPGFIFHLGAQSFPKTSFDIPLETLMTNVIGTAGLLEAVKLLKRDDGYDPVVHVCSSSEVYGKAKIDSTIVEGTPFHGASPYSISKIGTDYLGQFYGEAYNIKTVVTRMGTHSGPRRSDVFFESTVAKQIALIEFGLQEPVLKLGNLNSTRTFQDARDAVRAYYLLALELKKGAIKPGSAFNIAGDQVFTLAEVVRILLSYSKVPGIKVELDKKRLRPIDADYQMFDNSLIKSVIDWKPEIRAEQMFLDLLNHWRSEVAAGRIPLNR